MKQASINYNLPLMIIKEGKRYVAYTPALDISTSGKTVEQAQKRFGELVGLFFEEVMNMGTLDKVLEELGWQKQKQEWRPPVVVSKTMHNITLPAFA